MVVLGIEWGARGEGGGSRTYAGALVKRTRVAITGRNLFQHHDQVHTRCVVSTLTTERVPRGRTATLVRGQQGDRVGVHGRASVRRTGRGIGATFERFERVSACREPHLRDQRTRTFLR